MKKFFEEFKIEFDKVVWPTKKEVTNATILSVGLSFAVAIYLGAFDFIVSKLLDIIV